MTATPRSAIPLPGFTSNANWLITSAAAKVDITRRLRRALAPRRQLYATDLYPLSAALHFADASFLLPPLDHPDHLAALIEKCRAYHIRVILPTRDADLLHYSRNLDDLLNADICPILSPAASIETCLDKIQFHKHCLEHNLPVLPRIESPASPNAPVFVRGRHGAASQSARPFPSLEALVALHGPPPWPDLLIQNISSAPEYTIDALFDLDGSPLQWIARQRIRVRAGESTISRTLRHPDFDQLVPAIANTLHLVGPITIQAFHTDSDGPQLIEINPRIGGAAALGIQAGLDIPERLAALAQHDLDTFRTPRPLRYNLTMLRYTQDLFIEPQA